MRQAVTEVPHSLRGEVHIIDDFYEKPDAVRRLALDAEFVGFDGRANFPGGESVKAYWSPQHRDRFAELVGKAIDIDPSQWVFGKFRLALANETGRTKVHVDFVDWTAVIYLSLDTDCSGGLGIYRHRETGLERVPRGSDLAAYRCSSLEEFDSRYIMRDSLHDDRWELLHQVDIRYNRCVLFRGSRLFHGITRTFGGGSADGRLTQNFFFMDAVEGSSA
ncbi:hypothetical protein JQS43_12515 [Natronosporangium hydrolyticum]|uniref:Uncharacterized protein n=1 Tax=Natronosporangium hydrolyticum TaxID=2811111 RepID=A0A895YM15_9ACTN|nr:DUF6445 family protein [Natronosporangium hydrolyticum]QSB17012.1 hypothetical protein JQS43_12515 [Natronosporangium hydrolyticum]